MNQELSDSIHFFMEERSLVPMDQPSTIPSPDLPQTSQGRERLVSLDVFRGITIAGMILVNTPGSVDHVYHPLTYAAWHGCLVRYVGQ
jgi:predicted acyltransferase